MKDITISELTTKLELQKQVAQGNDLDEIGQFIGDPGQSRVSFLQPFGQQRSSQVSDNMHLGASPNAHSNPDKYNSNSRSGDRGLYRAYQSREKSEAEEEYREEEVNV